MDTSSVLFSILDHSVTVVRKSGATYSGFHPDDVGVFVVEVDAHFGVHLRELVNEALIAQTRGPEFGNVPPICISRSRVDLQ